MVVFTTSHIGRNARTKKVIAFVMTNIRRTNADRLLNNWNCFDMRTSEYTKLYGLRNNATGRLILYYWASSQKHKALFSSREKAADAAINVVHDIGASVSIVEFE